MRGREGGAKDGWSEATPKTASHISTQLPTALLVASIFATLSTENDYKYVVEISVWKVHKVVTGLILCALGIERFHMVFYGAHKTQLREDNNVEMSDRASGFIDSDILAKYPTNGSMMGTLV